ncbi:serine/threonine-protein kinase [Arenivirga flava]|uniref:non-specific serine/threonine protein kinase n=1 Tax=Arenivirga flava TaxID=1930060 RepID=A0AA37UEU1_9MICO|nr:serine/threonine-protein kinase [Arenivirga flava]GMA27818.1 serine/threonine protein kinase [Arenivirga flava]
MRRAPSTPPDIPGFEFVRLLGSGGFADVFLYEQQLPRRQVAVKVLLTEELTEANRAAFVAEANLMAQLSAHPYIVSIYHADVAPDGRPYLIMEYCSGPNLGEQYKQRPFAVVDALRVAIRVSSAVATAHQAGILHRDIKPANVLTNSFGWPALTDFGIASQLEELPVHTTTAGAGDLEATGTGGNQSVGMSIPWSPAEMFEDDPRPDVRSDVFSLAATVHTLLAGRTPFELRGRSNGTLDLVGRIERGQITPFERTDLPRSLVAVLQKAMSVDPAQRFDSAVDFARALQRIELELGYAPTAIDVPNLFVPEPERGPAGGDDETRVRSVATVEAQPQPAAPPAPPSPAEQPTTVRGVQQVAQPAPVDESTIIRSAASDQRRGAEEPERVVQPQRSRRGLIASIVAGAAVLVIGGAVAAGVVLTGGQPNPEPSSSAPVDPEEQSAVGPLTPTPELVASAFAAGDPSASFEVANPEFEDGDRFRWQRVDVPESIAGGARLIDGSTEAASFTVEGTEGASSVCVKVWIIRDGAASANPLEVCAP